MKPWMRIIGPNSWLVCGCVFFGCQYFIQKNHIQVIGVLPRITKGVKTVYPTPKSTSKKNLGYSSKYWNCWNYFSVFWDKKTTQIEPNELFFYEFFLNPFEIVNFSRRMLRAQAVEITHRITNGQARGGKSRVGSVCEWGEVNIWWFSNGAFFNVNLSYCYCI